MRFALFVGILTLFAVATALPLEIPFPDDSPFPAAHHSLMTNSLTERFSDEGAWQNEIDNEFVYSSEGAMTQKTVRLWDQEQHLWMNSARYTYSYRWDGLVSNATMEMWNQGAWSVNRTQDYEYQDTRLVHITYQIRSGNAWTNLYYYTHDYDNLNRLESLLIQSWSGETQSWNDYYFYEYEYDNEDRKTQETLAIWTGMVRMDYSRKDYEYDGETVSVMIYSMYTEGDGWFLSNRHEYAYTDNALTLDHLFDYVNGAWIESERITYVNDSEGNPLTWLDETYNEAWTPFRRGSNEYGVVSQGDPVAAHEIPRLTCRPNPMRASAMIEASRALPETAFIMIYDARGRKIRTLSGKIWDGRDDSGKPVSDGLYLLRTTTGGVTLTGKAILIR
jgi:hypothetical protein